MNSKSLRSLFAAALLSAIVVPLATAAPPSVARSAAPKASAKAVPAACAPTSTRTSKDVLALRIVGLTADQRLICFSDISPQNAVSLGFVSGLLIDTSLIGIDYRVQDGALYGVGNAGGVYALNTTTAVATLVNRLSVPLSGTQFGVDFNPAADRLRIISDDGQNLRHNVNAGGITLVDTANNYTVGTPTLGVTGAGYTNNDLSANTATTLFDVDTVLDQVALQSPPNNGSLAATGKLGLDAVAQAGFDVYSTIRNGVTIDNEAYAVLASAGAASRLFEINLTTGRAILRGVFAGENVVVDVAVPLDQR